nr:nucleotide-binding alpha-beta plait domain-containing protein [Tanacetum cinerariifolium]
MGSFRSKEDDVSKNSTSIFVTNFPESFTAKDLFHSCKVYSHVVDSFIPLKRSREGKRFGFVRFINVFNVERLVSNLCTIWVGRIKLHANIARFNKAPANGNPKSGKPKHVKEDGKNRSESMESESSIAIWGELLDFDDQEDLYFHSKRLCIYTKLRSNIFENFKIVYRGKVCWIRAKEVLGWILEFLDDSDDENQSEEGINYHEPVGHDEHSCGDDNDVNEVAETLFDDSSGQKKNHSEDPFSFYPLLNKNKDDMHVNGTEDKQSIKYPLGFTPEAKNREFNLSEDNVRSTNVENLQPENDVEILD